MWAVHAQCTASLSGAISFHLIFAHMVVKVVVDDIHEGHHHKRLVLAAGPHREGERAAVNHGHGPAWTGGDREKVGWGERGAKGGERSLVRLVYAFKLQGQLDKLGIAC